MEKKANNLKRNGSVKKCEDKIVEMLSNAEKGIALKDLIAAAPEDCNKNTWTVRIYHLKRAGILTYNKTDKIVCLLPVTEKVDVPATENPVE